ncbi:junctional adhesion molecule A-like [Stegodyphus dumicola]|uniref:junctional adhesion molecule A-like n=1 Tax=Stegodyphus dumicola TaxID=202533 RepID=UPI0015ADCBD6|nr:junctional adhesion molecule A-like [Stegodyphus dumicola]
MVGKLVFACLLVYAFAFQGKPSFDKGYETVAAEEGALLQITCSAKGTPPITHTWFDKDDLVVSEMPFNRIFSVARPNETLIVFKNTTRQDSGEYTCSASNIHGMVSKVYQLFIIPKLGTDQL